MLSVVAVLALLCGAPKYAQAIYDGVPSTGSFTIVTNSALAEATASGTLAVVSTTGLLGKTVTVGAYQFRAGRDFVVGASTMASATSLKNAINASPAPVLATYAIGDASIALAGKSPGALYNSVTLRTTESDNISVSGANLTGGVDNAVVYINAIPLVQGRDWFVQDVASNTAVNLAASINHNAQTSQIVSATWLGAASTVVYLRSLLSPFAYTLSDSAGTAITSPDATMVGGSAGNITPYFCFLGSVNALPTTGYPAGCLLFLRSAPTKVYLSTQAVTGAVEQAANSWLAIP